MRPSAATRTWARKSTASTSDPREMHAGAPCPRVHVVVVPPATVASSAHCSDRLRHRRDRNAIELERPHVVRDSDERAAVPTALLRNDRHTDQVVDTGVTRALQQHGAWHKGPAAADRQQEPAKSDVQGHPRRQRHVSRVCARTVRLSTARTRRRRAHQNHHDGVRSECFRTKLLKDE